jgi:uncharacterized protein YegP (UPF0339 family)
VAHTRNPDAVFVTAVQEHATVPNGDPSATVALNPKKLGKLMSEIDARSYVGIAFELLKTETDRWQWQLKDGDGQVILRSINGRDRRQDARLDATSFALLAKVFDPELVARARPTSEAESDRQHANASSRFVRYTSQDEQIRWQYTDEIGRPIAECASGYASVADVRRAISHALSCARFALTIDAFAG